MIINRMATSVLEKAKRIKGSLEIDLAIPYLDY